MCARFWVRQAEEGCAGGPGVAHSQTTCRRTQRAPAGWLGGCPSPAAAHLSAVPASPVPLLTRLQVPSGCRQGPALPSLCPSAPHLTRSPLPSATSEVWNQLLRGCCCPQCALACSPWGPLCACGPLSHPGLLSGQSAGQAMSRVSAVAPALKPAACPSACGSWPVTPRAGLKPLETRSSQGRKGEIAFPPGPPIPGGLAPQERAPEASRGGSPPAKGVRALGGGEGCIPLSTLHCLHVQTGHNRSGTLAFLGHRRPVPVPGGVQDSQCLPDVQRAPSAGRDLGLLGRWGAGSEQGSAPGPAEHPPHLPDHGPQGAPGALRAPGWTGPETSPPFTRLGTAPPASTWL